MTERMTERYSPQKWFDRAVEKTPEWVPSDDDAPAIDLPPTLPDGVKICATGVVLPEGLDYEEWVAVGRALVAIAVSVLWALGEWWAFGRHKYGHRAMIAEELPYEFKYLCNLGWVARSIPTSSRNEALSFTHHMKVAKLEPGDQKYWLEKAAEEEWSANKLEQNIKDADKTDSTEKDREFKENDPDGYRVAKARKAGLDALYQFEKISKGNFFLEEAIKKIITDEQFLADLDKELIAKLIRTASSVAEMFNEVVSLLKEHQKQRASLADEKTEDVQSPPTKPRGSSAKRLEEAANERVRLRL
jgi:hypothetical protein